MHNPCKAKSNGTYHDTRIVVNKGEERSKNEFKSYSVGHRTCQDGGRKVRSVEGFMAGERSGNSSR
jgi:hypothetical protein